MSTLAAQAPPVLALFAPACAPPTFLPLQLLAVAAALTTGRRTACDLPRALGHPAHGAPSSGLGTTRGRCARKVPRAEPCLFGPYGVAARWCERLPAQAQARAGVEGEGQAAVTFSDAITRVRRWLWTDWAFAAGGHAGAFAKLPEPPRRALPHALAPAARTEIRISRDYNSQEKSRAQNVAVCRRSGERLC